MIRRVPGLRCWKECLCFVLSLVASANGVYSSAERVVGMQMMGIVPGMKGSRRVGLSK